MNADGAMFEATAMPDPDWWQALWPDPDVVLRQLGIDRGMTVVDLCCGDGRFTVALAAMLDGRVYALDLDPGMLATARAAVEGSGGRALGWLAGDARMVDRLVPETVDFVLCANTFHGVPDQTGLARAVNQVLAPDGRFAVVNWHATPRRDTTVLGQPRGPRDELRMPPERVRAVVEPAGFRHDKTVELPPYHYGIVFAVAG